MKIYHQIISGLYPLLRCKYNILKIIGRKNSRLRVLLYHDIHPTQFDSFARQLCWLKERWSFVNPEQFSEIIKGDRELISDSILLTFDDGFKSNRLLAEKVLSKMGIQALFFVVPKFINVNTKREAKVFISKNIYPNLDISEIPEHWSNMNWDDIKFLIDHGHTIGSHTLSHAKLSKLTQRSELEYEINLSAEILEGKLNTSIEHFAYTFGDLSSFSKEAFFVAAQKYNFIYTGLRGNNVSHKCPVASIRRDSVTATDRRFLIGAYLEGAVDFHYQRSKFIIDSWANDIYKFKGELC